MDDGHLKYLAFKMAHAGRKMLIIKRLEALDPVVERLETMNMALDVMEKRILTGDRSSGITDEWIVNNVRDGIRKLEKISRLIARYGDLEYAWDYYSAICQVCAETMLRGIGFGVGKA